ncbi:hypothetical protein Tco_0716649 [Tanacetum coccineum]
MFEDNSYKAHEDHKNLFKALQKSLERDYSNQLLADLEEARRKKRKKRDSPSGSPPPQPPPPLPLAGASGTSGTSGASGSSQLPPPHPPPPPSIDINRGNQQKGSGASSSSKTVTSTPQSMVWTTSDTRYESASFTATQETSPTDYLMNDDSISDEQVYLSDDEDTRNNHLPKADMIKDWWKPLPEEERPSTLEPTWTTFSNVSDVEECHKMLTDQITWANPEGDQVRIDVSRPLPLGGPPGHILSVVRIKAYSRYGYDYLSEIVLRRANFQEYKIAKKDFKNLYPIDFEDLNLLLLQDYLDHLSGSDKRMLSTTVKLWTRNLVIRQRVKDFQLGIESYQKQLNLTKPGWDAKGYKFKHDYTIIESPRAVVFPKDMTRSKEFMSAINRRLKTRRIYQNLECFVGGRVRDIDYRLL